MINKIISILLMFSILLSMSGCWSKKEINNLGIVGSVIYDIDASDMLDITVDVLNYGGNSGGSMGSEVSSAENSFSTFSGSGENVSEALTNLTKNYEKSVYLPFVKARFFTDTMAAKGIKETVDYLLYDRDIRENAYIGIIKCKNADKVYSAAAQLSTTLGGYIEGLHEIRKDSDGASVFIEMLEFTKAINSDERDAVAGVLEVLEKKTEVKSSDSEKSEEQEYSLLYNGAAVFRKDIFVGYLDTKETQGYNFVTGDIKNCIVTLTSGELNRPYSIQILSTSCDINVSYENGQAVIDLALSNDVMLLEGKSFDSSSHSAKQIASALNKNIRDMVEGSIKKVQNVYNSDIYGFGERLHHQHPEIWKEIKDNWRNIYKNAKINLTSELKIKRLGETLNPFKNSSD